MSSPETNPERRGYLDNLGRLARLYLPRIILGSLVGVVIAWGSIGLAYLTESAYERNEQDIRIRSQYSSSSVSDGNRWFVEHDREMVISGAAIGGIAGLAWAWAIEAEKNA